MTDIIERAETALEGVTEGPWQNYEFSGSYYVAFMNDDSGPAMRIGSWNDEREANARFIAAARTLLPEAVEEIKRLIGVLEEVDAWVDDLAPYADFGAVPAPVFMRVKAVLAEIKGEWNV